MSELTIVPSRERFTELAKQGNVIPVFVDFVADGETPASAFQKLDDGGYSFLFESAETGAFVGRDLVDMHEDDFSLWVAVNRASGRLKNDDVALGVVRWL